MPLSRTSLIAGRPRAWWLVLLVVAFYALFFSAYTVQRHNAFLTSAYDLGNFDQAIWNTAQGRPLALTTLPGVSTRLAHHVEPILFLIAPLYWVWSDVRVLLILQSVVLAAGAIPLFWYGARHVGAGPATVFAIIYLLFPALQGVNLFDFHAVALAPTLLLFAWNWLDERRDRAFLVAAFLAAMTKEEIGLIVAMMGLYALVVQRRRFGMVPLLFGTGWFFLTLEVITPWFNPDGQHEFLGYYSQFGESGLDVAGYLLLHPIEVASWLGEPRRLGYLRDLLSPVLGASLLAPHVLLLAGPSLAVNLFSTFPPMTTLEGYHYPAAIVPFVVAAAVTATGWATKRVAGRYARPAAVPYLAWSAALILLAATLLYHRERGYTPLAEGWQWPAVTSHHRIGAQMVAGLPPDAAVSAQSQINPHLSQREKVYRFPDVRDADFIMLDVTVADLFAHPNDLRHDIQSRLESGEWGVYDARDGWLLLERCDVGRACTATLPDSFYSYALSQDPHPDYPADIRFGGKVRLLGYDVEQSREGTRVRLYWEALEPITEPLRLWPLFYDPNWQEVLETTELRPLMETVWYPPRMWKPGQIVQTTTLPWQIGDDWNLGVAVLAAADPSSERLPVTLAQSRALPEQPHQNLVSLLKVREGQVLQEGLRRYSVPGAAQEVGAVFGEGIGLAAVHHAASASPGDTFPVTLFWQAGEAAPERDYTVFLQLIGPTGLISQADGYPTSVVEGEALAHPTSGWLPGEVVADVRELVIPEDVPPGEYTLIAGLYDLSDGGTRLPAWLDGVPVPDAAVPLGTIRVQSP